MKNNNQINDVRTALFTQLERLADPNCNIEKEGPRTKAMVSVTNQIINSARVEVDVFRLTGRQSTDFIPTLKAGENGKTNKQLGDGSRNS